MLPTILPSWGLRGFGLSFASTRDYAVLLPFYYLFRRIAKRPASLELQPVRRLTKRVVEPLATAIHGP
jgi:hypothetical protein